MQGAAWDAIPSPFGRMVAVVNADNALTSLSFAADADNAAMQIGATQSSGRLAQVRQQLGAYLAGELQRFDLPLAPRGTAFQQQVWQALCAIPFGETRSYGELAQQLGKPGAARAMGRANATNPIALIVPCHRVIGGDGSLTGYAGGLPLKQALLAFERSLQPLRYSTPSLFGDA